MHMTMRKMAGVESKALAWLAAPQATIFNQDHQHQQAQQLFETAVITLTVQRSGGVFSTGRLNFLTAPRTCL